MYCRNCGRRVDDERELCQECSAQKENNNVASGAINSNTSTAQVNNEAKSKVAAGLFGIFLGCFGVHNFYLGFTGKAVAQLLITVLSCGVLSGISGLWGLIEGILILAGSQTTDANGVVLKD